MVEAYSFIEGKVAGQRGRARSFAHGTTKQQREMDEYQCEAVQRRGCELLCNLGAVRPRWVSGRRASRFVWILSENHSSSAGKRKRSPHHGLCPHFCLLPLRPTRAQL